MTGLDNSERIVCQIISDAFIKLKNIIFIFYFFDDRLLARHNRVLD